MLNYKCKYLGGRSFNNKDDALVIAEVKKIGLQIYAEVNVNKKKEIIIQIICDRVMNGIAIYTCGHRTYKALESNNCEHKSLYHKYKFVNNKKSVHT